MAEGLVDFGAGWISGAVSIALTQVILTFPLPPRRMCPCANQRLFEFMTASTSFYLLSPGLFG